MRQLEKVMLASAAERLYRRLGRPSNPTEYAMELGIERVEAVELLERGWKAKVVGRWEQWVVRGHLIKGAYGPAKMRRERAEEKRRKVWRWLCEEGEVTGSYGALAEEAGVSPGDLHEMMGRWQREGRIEVEGRTFRVKHD